MDGQDQRNPCHIIMEIIKNVLHDFLIMFAMVNAVGNLPIFADLTGNLNKMERKRTFLIAVAVGGGIVLLFALFGDLMLRNVFDVSTSAFKIAGGILVFAVAARGVLIEPRIHQNRALGPGKIAIFPLGFPYLAGPGTILTTILLIQTEGRLMTAITVVLVYLTILPILYLAPLVEKAIGKVGVMVIARILYIFISAKGVTFILDGLKVYL
jgi:multiple antibiotic resistance protein